MRSPLTVTGFRLSSKKNISPPTTTRIYTWRFFNCFYLLWFLSEISACENLKMSYFN